MKSTAPPPRSAITFRPYSDADLPFLRYVYGSTRAEEMQLVPWSDEQKAQFLDMQFSAQKNHYEEFYPGCEFLVIELEGTPIGRLYVDRSDRDIRLIDIALVPELRGRGIGRTLIEEILAEAREAGKSVMIYVEHFNQARRLYDRLGFRHIDTNGVYHRMVWVPPAP